MNALTVFDNFFKSPFMDTFNQFDTVFPKVDKNYSVYERDGKFFIEYSMPGLEEQDINVKINKEDRKLIVVGKKSSEEDQTDENEVTWHHRGNLNYSFNMFLPEKLNLEKVNAEYISGQIQISFELQDIEAIQKDAVIDVKVGSLAKLED